MLKSLLTSWLITKECRFCDYRFDTSSLKANFISRHRHHSAWHMDEAYKRQPRILLTLALLFVGIWWLFF